MRFRSPLFVTTLISFVACHQPKQFIPDPQQHLTEELAHRRVIMVADFAHEYSLPYQTLVDILSVWVERTEDPSYQPRSLALFLEEDDQIASSVRDYVATGNLDPFLELALPSTTLERLEFYAELRRLTMRIDTLNLTLPVPNKVSFDIQGPDPVNAFDPILLDSSRQAGISYFINRRDSLTAIRAIKYLKAHPSSKALFFYGAAHLIKATVAKNVGGEAPADQSVGNYLAFYLKKEFGDAAVLSVNQLSRLKMSSYLSNAPLGDIFVYSGNTPWKSQVIRDNNLRPANFDAFILRDEDLCPWHPLSQVFSTRTIDASVRRLDQLAPHRSGSLASRFYNEALQALMFVSGDSLVTPEKWNSRPASFSFDPIQRLRSARFREQLTTYYMESNGRPDKIPYLRGLGFPESLARSQSLPRPDWNALLDQTIPQTIFLNCIGIALIGTPDERAVAKKYLSDFSGQRYQDADRYLKWWRAKYCSISY